MLRSILHPQYIFTVIDKNKSNMLGLESVSSAPAPRGSSTDSQPESLPTISTTRDHSHSRVSSLPPPLVTEFSADALSETNDLTKTEATVSSTFCFNFITTE